MRLSDLPPNVRNRVRKDATRQRTNGKALERIVLTYPGVPITQVPQAARVIRKGGQAFTLRQRGPCDFFGCINGRMLVFDAKESGLAHRLQTSDCHLPAHQRSELIRYGREGAIAGLLVMRTTDGALFWCDYRLLVMPGPSIAYEAMSALSRGGPVNWFEVERVSDSYKLPHGGREQT